MPYLLNCRSQVPLVLHLPASSTAFGKRLLVTLSCLIDPIGKGLPVRGLGPFETLSPRDYMVW